MPTINIKTEIPGPRARAIIERKGRVVADALDLHANVVIDRASGAAFTDVDGNTFLDFSGGLGCHIVGYSHPKVVEAVQRDAGRFSHTDFSVIPYESYVTLSERLVAAMGGGEKKVFLANSGAEAVENAVKIARNATRRPAVIAFEGAFHGRTLMAMSLTSRHAPYKTGFGPFAPEVYRVPFSYPYRSPFGEEAGAYALDALDRAFTTMVDPQTVAAIIVEPVQGEGGFVVPTPDFLPGVTEIARRHGILVIADEIQSGFGRTGRFLASEHFPGFEPDLVTLGKSLASGYPLTAVVGRADVVDATGPSQIGGTYVGNPVACSAAIAALEVLQEERLMERADEVGKTIRSRWEDVARDLDVGEIRGLGAMIGVEFVTDRKTKEPDHDVVASITSHTTARGVVSVGCGIYKNVLRHLMPLVITDEQLAEGLDVMIEAASDARSGAAPIMETGDPEVEPT